MDMRLAFILVLGLAGCASPVSETVYLENAQGERVQCGPYFIAPIYGYVALAQESLRNCIEDFQIQYSWERLCDS